MKRSKLLKATCLAFAVLLTMGMFTVAVSADDDEQPCDQNYWSHQVEMQVRNVTQGAGGFSGSVTAAVGDTVEFKAAIEAVFVCPTDECTYTEDSYTVSLSNPFFDATGPVEVTLTRAGSNDVFTGEMVYEWVVSPEDVSEFLDEENGQTVITNWASIGNSGASARVIIGETYAEDLYPMIIDKIITPGVNIPSGFYIEVTASLEDFESITLTVGDDYYDSDYSDPGAGKHRWMITGLRAGIYTATEYNYQNVGSGYAFDAAASITSGSIELGAQGGQSGLKQVYAGKATDYLLNEDMVAGALASNGVPFNNGFSSNGYTPNNPNVDLRGNPANAFGIPDATNSTDRESNTKFTGMRFFNNPDGISGITYWFCDEDGVEQEIHHHPSQNVADLSLIEVTWNDFWHHEAVDVYLVDAVLADGSTEAMYYLGRVFNHTGGSPIKVGAIRVEFHQEPFASGVGAFTRTDIYFPSEVVKASAVRIVDATDGVNDPPSGRPYYQYDDGYDLDAIRAWCQLPTLGITLQNKYAPREVETENGTLIITKNFTGMVGAAPAGWAATFTVRGIDNEYNETFTWADFTGGVLSISLDSGRYTVTEIGAGIGAYTHSVTITVSDGQTSSVVGENGVAISEGETVRVTVTNSYTGGGGGNNERVTRDTGTPTVSIPDPVTPLTPFIPDDPVNIPADEVPLADIPTTGTTDSGLLKVLIGLSLLGLLSAPFIRRKKEA